MPNDVTNLQRITNLIASLFHDIGKFRYRCLPNEELLPHSVLGAESFIQFGQRFTALTPILTAVAEQIRHHHTDSPQSCLVRANHFDLPENLKVNEIDSTQPLTPIFRVINTLIDKNSFISPSQLAIPENEEDLHQLLIPGNTTDENKLRLEHAQLWDSFINAINQLPTDLPLPELVNSLYFILWKYTSRISTAGPEERSCLALFDHLRLTAAVSDALFCSNNADKPLLLISGDISGIQDFIYRLAEPDTKQPKMAKRLRGRSFYLSILSETVSQAILDQLGLYSLNLIINGGGHFIIIAPNNPDNEKILQQLEIDINTYFYSQFEGQLSLLLAWQAFSLTELRQYDSSLRQLGLAVRNQKSQKYFSILEQVFKPNPTQARDICTICHNDCQKSPCELCRTMLDFGSELVYTDYLVRVTAPTLPSACRKTGSITFNLRPDYSIHWIPLTQKENLALWLNTLSQGPVRAATLYELNPGKAFTETPYCNIPLTYGFIFAGNFAPRDKTGVLEFEELTRLDEKGALIAKDDVFKMLGILRMDMDNLGQVFSNLTSISTVINLSRELQFLFTAPINYLARKYHLYVTYSGGDDLFVLGRWHFCIEFACALQKLITKWACSTPQISISAAIFMCKPTYPIRQAAASAKELLEEYAKHYTDQNQAKNACYLFDDVYHWRDIAELLDYGKNLEILIDQKLVPRSFIHNLITLCKRCNPGEHTTPLISTAWVSSVKHLIHYALARRGIDSQAIDKLNRGEIKESERFKSETLVRLLDPNFFRKLRIPTSYALYKTR